MFAFFPKFQLFNEDRKTGFDYTWIKKSSSWLSCVL